MCQPMDGAIQEHEPERAHEEPDQGGQPMPKPQPKPDDDLESEPQPDDEPTSVDVTTVVRDELMVVQCCIPLRSLNVPHP